MTQPAQPIEISVSSPDATYSILIGGGLLAQLPDLLSSHKLSGKPAVVTNTTIAPLYGNAMCETLGATLITLPDGEQYKTLDSVRAVYDGLIEGNIDRRGPIVALGGGVIGDLAGFAAASYLRGVPFVQVPTSLLSMVDSSVGGKVGVDLPQGKNLVGAFKQPALVIIDTDVLRTLPDAEWRCGVAEVIKAGLLHDESLLNPVLYDRNMTDLGFIRRAVQFKVDIVQKDPYEHGERAYLNLGHTFGHAVERVSGYTWRHGEAVGFGLVAAAHLSARIGLCDEALAERVESLVRVVGLPTRCAFDPEEIRAAMATDKKRQADRLRFVLLRGIGQPTLAAAVPDSTVIEVLSGLRS